MKRWRRADRLITAGAGARRPSPGCWPSRGGRASGATRGSTCAPASATGAGSRSWRPTWPAASSSESFTRPGIDRFWSDNAPDHPVIMKTLYGLSWRAFHRCNCTGPTRGLHPIPVQRAPHHAAAVRARVDRVSLPGDPVRGAAGRRWSTGSRAHGCRRRAAAAAAVLTLAQPHYFFHAPIACFDAPITTMAFAVGFAYWKSLRSPRWGIAAGVLFGIALGVKHNAWLMPFFLVGHYLWMRRARLPARCASRGRRWRSSRCWCWGRSSSSLHWPWLWNAPVARTRAYVNRHLQHEHYNFEYLGLNWNNPPTTTERKLLRATAPFVQTGLTVPVTTLALAVAGRRRAGAPAARRAGGAGPDAGAIRRPPSRRPRNRAGCARAPTSIARPARSWRCRSWARWRC